jgi:hypothetical protein
MSSETMNHDLLIATEKTPHKVITTGPTDIIIDPSGKPLPGVNWDDLKKLRKAGPGHNTQNTFIDGATIFIRTGRIDASSQSSHPVAGPGKSSGIFRGDTRAVGGSLDLIKEGRCTMRTTDTTGHNCMPPMGPQNTSGKVIINLAAVDLKGQLRDQIQKLCQIVEKDKTGAFLSFGKCSHKRAIPNGGQLEVVKSSNAPLVGSIPVVGKHIDDPPETLEFEVTRMDTTIAPPGPAKCQQPGEHASWTAMYGDKIIKQEKGVDKFKVDVPGWTSPALTGVLAAVKWGIDTWNGPKLLTVTAVSCAGSRSSIVRCYPNGKVAVNFAAEKTKFEKLFQPINEAAWAVKYLGQMLNGGSVGKMKFEILPAGCELAYETEFKERDNHLVGREWKATFGFNPLCVLDFSWPVPIHVFLGPFGTVAKVAQWLLERAGLQGMFFVGFFFQIVLVGAIGRDKDGKFTPGFEGALELTPNCQLQLVRGGLQDPTHKVTVMLAITFSVKLKMKPNDKGQGGVKGVISGEIAIGFTIEYFKKGAGTSKLVDYKPEWAKWPKKEGAWDWCEFVVLD